MSRQSIKSVSLHVLTVAIASAGPFAHAEEATLDQIIVKAQRRAEASQDVPITINTLDSEMLKDAGVSQLNDIAELAPALRFDHQGAWTQPSIRGVGSAIVTAGAGANVGIYVDGFYVPNPLALDFQLMNIENVQILKGPQGTLFGRNSTGGAILISSSKPSTETRGVVEASYGSYNSQKIGGYVTTGLTDKAAIDFDGVFESGDGYWDNVATGNDDDAEYDNWSGRVGLAVELSDDVNLLLRFTHHDVDDGRPVAYNVARQDGVDMTPLSYVPMPPSYTPVPIPAELLATSDPDDISSNAPFFVKTETDAFQMTIDFDLGFGTLTSYSQYRDDDTHLRQDNDGSAADVFILDLDIHDDLFTQELLLASKSESDLQWTAGLFFMNWEDSFQDVRFSLNGFPLVHGAGSTLTTRTYAAYFDVTKQIVDDLYLTFGTRYSKDESTDGEMFVAGVYEPVNEDWEDRKVDWRAVLRYELDENSSVYGSYSRGHKSGFQDVATPPMDEVGPETINAYELGYKYAGDRLGLEAAAFYYDYSNLQVAYYPAGQAFTLNAASSEIFGLEAQARYAVTPEFQVSISGAWVDAEYDDFPNSYRYDRDPIYGLYGTVPVDASGFEMQRAPEFTGTLSARYETDLADGVLALSGSLYYTSSFYFDPSEQFEEDAYATLGLRAAWTDPSGRYTLAMYGDNLTDEEYRTQIAAHDIGIGALWAAPLTVGASVTVNF